MLWHFIASRVREDTLSLERIMKTYGRLVVVVGGCSEGGLHKFTIHFSNMNFHPFRATYDYTFQIQDAHQPPGIHPNFCSFGFLLIKFSLQNCFSTQKISNIIKFYVPYFYFILMPILMPRSCVIFKEVLSIESYNRNQRVKQKYVLCYLFLIYMITQVHIICDSDTKHIFLVISYM